MSFKPTKLSKILALFFCLSFFITSSSLISLTPKKVSAQAFVPVWEVGTNMYANVANAQSNAMLEWKEFIGDGVIWEIVKMIIVDTIMEEILTEVADLFGGGVPAFVTDPIRYLKGLEKEIADIAINDILADVNLNEIDSLFGTDIYAILTDKHLGDADDRVSQILAPTLEAVVNSNGSFDEFKAGNFYEGGWAGFFSLTQNAKNNPIGSYFLTEDALARAQQERESIMLNELSWGDGFFSDRNGGQITLPGKTIADQLNEVLADELRTLENADEITEALALLAGSLISNIFSGGGLGGGGNFTYDTSTVGSATPPDDIGDINAPGGGDTISIDGEVTVLDIDSAFIQADAGTLRINLDDSGRMEMNLPTNSSPDNTITATQVTIPSLTFVRATGGTFDISGDGSGPFMPAGEVITLNNVTVLNPVFGTLSNSVAQNSGAITNATVIESSGFQADVTGARLSNVTLTLDDDATDENDLMDAVINEGDGTSISNITFITDPMPTSGSFPGDILRGGITEPGVITLDNVRLLGGTVVTAGGTTYTISSPSENLYCSTSGACNYNHSTSGITGSTLRINDTRNAWAIKSITWLEPKEATLTGGFEVYSGTVVGY